MKLTPHQIYRLQNNFRRITTLALILGIGTLVRIHGCKSDDGKKLVRGEEVKTGSGQELTGATLTAYDDTVRVWELKTQSLIQDPSIKEIQIAPVNLRMFNDSGIVTTHVISDSGLTSEKMDWFKIWGSVVITDKDYNMIKSRSLNWDKKDRKLHSVDYVEIITSSGERLRGKGFDAAEDFSWFEFHSNVEGEFKNIDGEFTDSKEEEK